MPLDRQTIIDKAFEVLDEHGVEGLSTRKLAEALGVSGPSLYWHFKTKRELFDHMTEQTLIKALTPHYNPPSDFDWRVWIADGARSIRREILSRRDGAQIFVGFRRTPERAAFGPTPAALILSRIGLDPRESSLILQTMSRFVMGWTLDEQNADVGTPEQREADFDFALAMFVRGAEAMAEDLLAAKSVMVG
jgi:TetR/AcrR family tetracycline transcriptional repressor